MTPEEIALLRGLSGDPAYKLLLRVVDQAISRLVDALSNPVSDEETIRIVNLYRAARFIRGVLEEPTRILEEVV